MRIKLHKLVDTSRITKIYDGKIRPEFDLYYFLQIDKLTVIQSLCNMLFCTAP